MSSNIKPQRYEGGSKNICVLISLSFTVRNQQMPEKMKHVIKKLFLQPFS